MRPMPNTGRNAAFFYEIRNYVGGKFSSWRLQRGGLAHPFRPGVCGHCHAKSKSPPCPCKSRRDEDGAPASVEINRGAGPSLPTRRSTITVTRSQSPRPVPAKDAGTRTGHPSQKTMGCPVLVAVFATGRGI
jgi:hypothetical protein